MRTQNLFYFGELSLSLVIHVPRFLLIVFFIWPWLHETEIRYMRMRHLWVLFIGGFTCRLRKEIRIMRCSFLNIIIASLTYYTTRTICNYLRPEIIIGSF